MAPKTAADWLNRCHFGDCIKTMRRMPDGLVQTCVTSPPYFGLRDYGHPGQIGHEATPAAFVSKLVKVFREVRRVLRDDGTLWLNLGDSYATRPNGDTTAAAAALHGDRAYKYKNAHASRSRGLPPGLKHKDLMGIPWRVAFALQADGWYLRNEIIWSKPNPMPESVNDRCTKSHEHLFLLAKSADYYCDMDAIKEPVAVSTVGRLAQNVEAQAGSDRVPGKTNGTMKAVGAKDERNRRTVWTVATTPYKGAHFATFPTELIEPCILAGAPSGGIVLDPFFGSGTTGQVSQNLGRGFIGCELNRDYETLQAERLQQPGLIL